MLADLRERLPAGGDWLYEVKWDGFRVVARIAGNEASLHKPRAAVDLGERFAAVARALPHALRTTRLRGRRRGVRAGRGRPAQLRPAPAGERRPAGLLRVRPARAGARAAGRPRRWRSAASGWRRCSCPTTRLRPAVAPRSRTARRCTAGAGARAGGRGGQASAARRYRPGRRSRGLGQGEDAPADDEFLIAGYTRGTGLTRGLGALVLAEPDGDGALRWVGNVGSGLDERAIDAAAAAARSRCVGDTPPITPAPRMPRVAGARS